MPSRLPPLPLQNAAKPVAKTAPAAVKPTSAPMTEAMIEHLVAKGKPDISEWVAALQDIGTDKSSTGFAKKQPTLVFEKIQKVAYQIAKIWKAEGASFVGSNVSRFAKSELTEAILSRRKLFPKWQVSDDIEKYLPKDHKRHEMYLFENEIGSAGYNTWAYNIVTMLAEREWHKTNFNRVPNDALRVSSIMMDTKYRNQIIHVMSNVKEEPAGLDISGISETAMYEDMVSDFNDQEYVAKAPEKAHLIEWDQKNRNNGPLDPNESIRIAKKRDSAWFQKTWLDYVRKEYRASLLRWNTEETGGGDGSSESFQNYCYTRTWLGWVYLLDEENGFILASNSTVRVPEHLQNESGDDSQSTDRKRRSVPGHLRNESGVDAQSTDKKRRKDITNDMMMMKLEEVQKNQQEFASQILARFDALATKLTNVDESDVLFEEHRKIVDDKKQITMDASMDADTKALFLEALKHRKEALNTRLKAYIDAKRRKDLETSGTSS